MTKTQAVHIFGGQQGFAAKCLGFSSRFGLSQWPELLNQTRADRVRGAAMRLGYFVPEHIRYTYYYRGELVYDRPLKPQEWMLHVNAPKGSIWRE